MLNLQSSNPALNNEDAFKEFYGSRESIERSDVATLQGVVNKTAMLAVIAVGAGTAGYMLVESMPSIMWLSCIAAFVISIGVYFVINRNPKLAPIVAPIYAIVEGVFLGALTGALDNLLVDMGYAAAGGIALQAFIITASILVAMLLLYKFRILKPTERFVSVVSTAVVGIMITYALSFVLSLFGIGLPFISLGSAMAGGTAGWIGLGINVLILGVAALWLIVDFGRVEQIVGAESPKSMEWYCAFALIVSLAWVYYEAVKLVFRLQVLLGRE